MASLVLSRLPGSGSLNHSSCFKSVVFPSATRLPCAPLLRKCPAPCAFSNVAEAFQLGVRADIPDSMLKLHHLIVQAAIETGLPLPPDARAASSWAMAMPLVLWYMFAAPGTAAGLLDFIYAPIHAKSFRFFSADEMEVGRQIGEGSFGVVYEGFYGKGKKGSETQPLHVVLKKAKTRVRGASEVHDSEIHMNYRLQRTAPAACAAFLGIVQVSTSEARGKLSEGAWLVWKFQGDRTLDFYLKQKNFPENISEFILGNKLKGFSKGDSFRRNLTIKQMVFSQILTNLQALHRCGVVHRDVKPLNLILAQDTGKFKFIDFGACVDLRSGYNYVPNETVIDPTYAAPEHYIMPTNTPSLPPDPLCSLVSPLFWHLNTPDRFDLYSAGLILMQLSLKPLRHDTGLRSFNMELKRAGYDLDEWRGKSRFGKEEFAYLDANGGAGWELARALLQARHDKDFLIWPSLGNSRPSAAAALQHRFFKGSIQIPMLSPEVPVPLQIPVTREEAFASGLPTLPSPALLTERIGRFVNGAVTVGQESHALQVKDNSRQREAIPDVQWESTPKKASQKASSDEKVGISMDLIGASWPTATAGVLAITAGWLVLAGLKGSAQVSYEIGRTLMSAIGLSGSGFLVFLFLIKPWLEEQEGNFKKWRFENQKKTGNDLAMSSSSEKLQELISNRQGYTKSEQVKVGLVEAVQVMEIQLASLEASILHEQQFFHQQQEILLKVENLLSQPSVTIQEGAVVSQKATVNHLELGAISTSSDLSVSG